MKNWILILMFCILGCTGVVQEPASSSRDQYVDFSKFRTFAWLPKDSSSIQNILYDNQIVEKNIRNYVNEELSNRGYKATNNVPDILLRYTFIIEKKQQSINYPIYSIAPFPSQVTLGLYNPNISNYGPYNNQNYNPFYNNQTSPYNVNFYANNYPYNNGYGYPVGSVIAYPNGNGVPALPSTYIAGTGFQQEEFEEGTLVIDVIDRQTHQLIWRGWSFKPLSDPLTFENHLPIELKGILSQFPGNAENISTKTVKK